MARPSSKSLTERETQIMEILWTQGQATAEEVRALLPDSPHDSSVRTMLRVLVSKGLAKPTRKRPKVYRPAVDRSVARTTAIRGLLKQFFSGSADELVQHLLDEEAITPEQLKRLRQAYDHARRKGDKKWTSGR